MLDATINYWAVLVSAAASFVLGGIWFSPPVFGKVWIQGAGMSGADMEHAKKGAWKSYIGALIGALVTAYVFAHAVDYAGAESAQDGLQAGFWMWLGFAAPIQIGSMLWENKRFSYFLVNTGHSLSSLLIMGVILAVWL